MLNVRCLSKQDLPSLIQLEKECFSSGWSDTQISNQLEHARGVCLGAFSPDCVGFVFLSILLDEAEVLQIAVDPKSQGRGVARALLDAAVVSLSAQGIIRLMLEVRESNQAAVTLYRRYGFVEDGRRKGYYPALKNSMEREDALLFSYAIKS